MPSHFAGLQCLGTGLTRSTHWQAGQRQKFKKMAEFQVGEKFSLYAQPLHSRSNLLDFNIRLQYQESWCEVLLSELYLFQSYLKDFRGPNFQSCCLLKFSKKIQVNLPHYWVISYRDGFGPAGFCLTICFWGESACILFEKQNILSKYSVEVSIWQSYRGRDYWLSSSIIIPA